MSQRLTTRPPGRPSGWKSRRRCLSGSSSFCGSGATSRATPHTHPGETASHRKLCRGRSSACDDGYRTRAQWTGHADRQCIDTNWRICNGAGAELSLADRWFKGSHEKSLDNHDAHLRYMIFRHPRRLSISGTGDCPSQLGRWSVRTERCTLFMSGYTLHVRVQMTTRDIAKDEVVNSVSVSCRQNGVTKQSNGTLKCGGPASPLF